MPFERGRFSPRIRSPDRQRATDRAPKRGQLREARTRQNCLVLARRLASPAPYGLAALRLGYPRFARRISPALQAAREEGRPEMEKAEAMLQTAEQGFKENYALLKKLSEM